MTRLQPTTSACRCGLPYRLRLLSCARAALAHRYREHRVPPQEGRLWPGPVAVAHLGGAYREVQEIRAQGPTCGAGLRARGGRSLGKPMAVRPLDWKQRESGDKTRRMRQRGLVPA